MVVPDGDVTIRWVTREVRLLRELDSAAGIAARFEAVGATATVELSRDERLALRDTVGEWLEDDEVPEQQGLIDPYIALNRGEPYDAIVELLSDGFPDHTRRWRWTHCRDKARPARRPRALRLLPHEHRGRRSDRGVASCGRR